MRYLLLLLTALSFPAGAVSFIMDVPSPQDDNVTHCRFSPGNVDSLVVVDAANGLPANKNRICKQDVTSLPAGSNSVTFQVLTKDASGVVWEVSPAAAPFVFVKPATGGVVAPTGGRLVP